MLLIRKYKIKRPAGSIIQFRANTFRSFFGEITGTYQVDPVETRQVLQAAVVADTFYDTKLHQLS